MEFKWKNIEQQIDFENSLYTESVRCIDEFGKINNNEELFYAFAFDTGIRNGHLGLCLNTTNYLDKEIANCGKKEVQLTTEEILEFKFDPGNWKYQAFNKFEFEPVAKIWNNVMNSKIEFIYETFENIIYSDSLEEEIIENLRNYLIFEFNKSVKNVTDKMKKNVIFNSIRTTKEFKIYSIDFDDDLFEVVKYI